MQKKVRNIVKNLLVGTVIASTVAGMLAPVFAENGTDENTPTLTQETANLTVRYFDDSDETIPVAGAEFTIYQVASIGRELNNNGAYVPLDENIDFSYIDETTYSDEDAKEYQSKVVAEYEKNPELGYKATLPIGDDGLAVFKDVPVGAYLITETKTTRYHITSIPFIVSTPEMNEKNTSWGFEITANPKPILAGDLEITKTLKGKLKEKGGTYTVKVNLPKGEYKAKLGDGTEVTVKNGDKLKIKGGQTITVYDLPSGLKYRVKEIEENVSRSYKTSYKKNEGKITEKSSTKVEIINDSTTYDTGAGYKLLFEFIAGGGALALMVFLIAHKSKNKEDREK